MRPTARDYAEEAKWRKALEPLIREQIAKEIEALQDVLASHGDDGSQMMGCKQGLKAAAAIARGNK